jgi:predicted secreted protein with PEFG-CTERM motif
MNNSTTYLFVILAIVVGLVATTPAAFADHSEVTIEAVIGSGVPGCEETAEGCYIPSTATVDVGGVVIMSNTDTAVHTFTAGIPSDGPSGEFDSGMVYAGSSFEWSPDTVGEIPYYCMVHPWMVGLIVVQETESEEVHEEEQEQKREQEQKQMKIQKGKATSTGMLSDGTKVSIWASTPTASEAMEISIEFEGAEHVNHDMTVTQNGEDVLMDEGAHHHDGTGVHTTAPLSSSDPVDITVTFTGYGVDDPKTGPIGEEVVFSNVVPEFGTIAMMILAVAIISIVAVTAKSRVVPRF